MTTCARYKFSYLWSPYGIGQTIIFSSYGFFLSSIFYLFSSPNLSRRTLDVYHTSTHENTGRQKVAKNHHLGTIAQLCRAISSQPRHVSTIGKKLVNQQYVLQMFHNMVNIGPLAAEICWRVWCTPAHFNGFHVLAALYMHGSQVVSISQTLRH